MALSNPYKNYEHKFRVMESYREKALRVHAENQLTWARRVTWYFSCIGAFIFGFVIGYVVDLFL